MHANQRFVTIAMLVFACLGAGLLWAGWRLHSSADLLLKQGLPATGTVVQVRHEERRTRHPQDHDLQNWQPRASGERGVYLYFVDVPVIRFRTRHGDELEVTGQPVVPGEVSAGTQVELLYLPDAPAGARERSALQSPVGPLALAALGTALLLPGLIGALLQLRRRAR